MRILGPLRRAPTEVKWLTVMFALLLVAWAQLAPLGRAPDELVHVDLIEHVASGAAYPDYDDRLLGRAPAAAWFTYNSTATDPLTPESAPPTGGGATRAQLGGDEVTTLVNQQPQHPPLYYVGMGALLRASEAVGLVHDDAPYDRQWGLFRLANAALVAPLPLLAWAAARRMGGGRHVATTAAAVPLAVPQLSHIGSTVNNDNLLVLLGGVLAVLLADVTAGDRSWRTAFTVGAVTGLALLTKAFAYAFIPWIVIVYVAPLLRRSPTNPVTPGAVVPRAAVAVGVALITGGWWLVHNLVRFGKPVPSALDGSFETAPQGFEPDLLWYGRHAFTTVTHRFWGSFGIFEAPLHPVPVTVVSALLAIALVAALTRRNDRELAPSPPSRASILAYGSVLLFTVVLVFYRSGSLYVSSGRLAALQGRYLFGAVVSLCVITAVGLVRLVRRRAALAVMGVVVVLQFASFHVALSTFWAEPDASLARSLRAMMRWSPWPDALVVVVLVAVALSTIGCTIALRRAERDPVRSCG